MRLTELNDEIVVLKELRHIDDLVNSFEFTLNESELLDEGAILDWVKRQSDKVTDFFDDFANTAALATDVALAERVADRIHKLTFTGKLKPVQSTLTDLLTKLNLYMQQFPSLSKALELAISGVTRFKAMLVTVYGFVSARGGFLKFIAAVAVSGLMGKIYDVIVRFADLVKNFVIDLAKDTVETVTETLKPLITQFLDLESYKEKLFNIVGSAAANTTGLGVVFSFFSGAADIIKYITALVKDALEFLVKRDAGPFDAAPATT